MVIETDRKIFAASAAAISLVGFLAMAPLAVAQDSRPGVYSRSAVEVTNQATEYSLKSGGVGVVLNFGPWEGVPSIESIGDKLLGMFGERGADAEYFIRLSDKPGLSILYAAQGTMVGPMPAREAVDRIDEVIAVNETNKKARKQLLDRIDGKINEPDQEMRVLEETLRQKYRTD